MKKSVQSYIKWFCFFIFIVIIKCPISKADLVVENISEQSEIPFVAASAEHIFSHGGSWRFSKKVIAQTLCQAYGYDKYVSYTTRILDSSFQGSVIDNTHLYSHDNFSKILIDYANMLRGRSVRFNPYETFPSEIRPIYIRKIERDQVFADGDVISKEVEVRITEEEFRQRVLDPSVRVIYPEVFDRLMCSGEKKKVIESSRLNRTQVHSNILKDDVRISIALDDQIDEGKVTLRPTKVSVTSISKMDSDVALHKVLVAIKGFIGQQICDPKESLFAFDLDETVLQAEEEGVARGIRSSDIILAAIQQMGISTVAITIRDAVPSEYHPRIERGANGDEAASDWKAYLYAQPNFVKEDLRSAGIDLSMGTRLFSDGKGSYNESGKSGPEGFFRLDVDKSFNPKDTEHLKELLYYAGGAIMASHKSKGRVLQQFLSLKGLDERYNCIFFVDDEKANIDAVEHTYSGTTDKQVFIFHVPKP